MSTNSNSSPPDNPTGVTSHFSEEDVDRLHAMGRGMEVETPFDREVEMHLAHIRETRKTHPKKHSS